MTAEVPEPLIAIGATAQHRCAGADYILPSFDPPKLLEFLRGLLPAAAQAGVAENKAAELPS